MLDLSPGTEMHISEVLPVAAVKRQGNVLLMLLRKRRLAIDRLKTNE